VQFIGVFVEECFNDVLRELPRDEGLHAVVHELALVWKLHQLVPFVDVEVSGETLCDCWHVERIRVVHEEAVRAHKMKGILDMIHLLPSRSGEDRFAKAADALRVRDRSRL